jgi:hypothetical protein
MQKIFFYFFTCFYFTAGYVFSQDSIPKPSLSFSFYGDAYIAYYSDSLPVNDYQKFPSIAPRSNQFGLDVASISARYTSNRARGFVTLQYGDVPRSTWSPTFNMVQEANFGVRVCKKLWVDAGFFRTHVGTEGLFPKENITSSVAVPTFFEPYYEAGLKLNYAATEKLALNLFILNGYNVFEDNNKKKSLGLLATYAFNDHLSVGYSNYIGDDGPDNDSVSHGMLFNNVFLNFEKNKIKIVTGADFCVHAHSSINAPNGSANMFSGLFSVRYLVTKKLDCYGRLEFFDDADGFLSGVMTDKNNHLTGLKLWGATLGLEYKPTLNSYVRFEGRDLMADDAQEIFYHDGAYTNSRLEVLLNFGVWFP